MDLPRLLIDNRCVARYINADMPKDKAKKTVAMIGYGSQGRALALNLRDSGYEVMIGLPSRSRSRRTARADGFQPVRTSGKATALADTIVFALPDHLHGRVYEADIVPNLRPGAALVFLHGLSVHFGLVQPPLECDVILVAPHAPGLKVRERYLTDRSISAFYAVHQDAGGKARAKALLLAGAMGFLRKNLLETTFEDEALGDIFGEQAVLCGGLAMLIKSGFEVLVENGLKPWP